MPDKTRFDPVGWFASICITVLIGAIALSVAVSLIRHIWPWLLGIGAVIAGIAGIVQLARWWHRRQPW